MMKFGNASWGFRETPLEEQLAVTAQMGLEALELGIANAPNDLPLDASAQQLEQVKQLYKKYGIALACAATGNDFTTGSDADVEKIKRVIDMCAVLGVTYLRIFAGFSPVDEVKGARWDTMIDCLVRVADYAEKCGVVPVVETHGGVDSFDDGVRHFYSTSSEPDTLCKMLDELPQSVKVCFDPANLYAVGIEHPGEVYSRIRERVATMHLKDFVTQPSGNLLPSACGESGMDWSKLLSEIGDFDGYALFEYENTGDVAQGLTRCFDYIKKELNK